MADIPMSLSHEQRHLSLLGRLLFLAVCGLSITGFWHFGWNAVGPHDPLGAVSLYTHPQLFLGLIQTIIFASLISAVATLVLGRKMPLIGPFAAGVGLVSLSTRGGTATYLILDRAAAIQQSKILFTFSMIAESLGWFAVLMAAIVSADIVARIVLGLPQSFPGFELQAGAKNEPQRAMQSNRNATASQAEKEIANRVMQHVLHMMICAVTAVVAIVIFSSGYRTRSVEHGQACFIAAAGMGLGTYIAHRVQPVLSSTWSLLAIAPVGIVGYAWTIFCQVNAGLPLPILTSPFLSLLPIQLVGAGVLGSVWVIWYFTGQPTQEN